MPFHVTCEYCGKSTPAPIVDRLNAQLNEMIVLCEGLLEVIDDTKYDKRDIIRAYIKIDEARVSRAYAPWPTGGSEDEYP